MALTKAAMAEMLFDELGLNKREAKEFVEQFFEEVRLALEAGHDVKLSGFGNFVLRNKNERPGRNPKTQDACRSLCWKSATTMNYQPYPISAISPLVKSAIFVR